MVSATTSSLLLASTLLLASVQAQTLVNSGPAQCQTGRIAFDPTRILALNGAPAPANIDVSKYDFTIDYGVAQVSVPTTGGPMTLSMTKDPAGGAAQGVRLSSTRNYLYAKITVGAVVTPVAGMVTAVITMSDRGDEIDLEFTTASTNTVYSNVFYKGIPEFALHDATLQVPSGIAISNVYALDWKSETLNWDINSVTQRSLAKNTSVSLDPANASKFVAGEKWYPSTPSKIQLAVWDGGSSTNAGTSAWAGGKVNWGTATSFSSTIQYVDIQCYDANNQPVAAYPASGPTNPPSTGKSNAKPSVGTFPTIADMNAVGSSTSGGSSSTGSASNTGGSGSSSSPNSATSLGALQISLLAGIIFAMSF